MRKASKPVRERVRSEFERARESLNDATKGARVTVPSGFILTIFAGAISFVASTFTSMYRESDNAGIRIDDARELRAQLIRCRDREADRTDAWLRLIDSKIKSKRGDGE